MQRLGKDVKYYADKMNNSSVGVLKTLDRQRCMAIGKGIVPPSELLDTLETLAALSSSLTQLKKLVRLSSHSKRPYSW
jgi:hypothetical protein